MVEPSRKLALGITGAAMAALGSAVGAAALLKRAGRSGTPGAEAPGIEEETSGRGTPGERPDAESLHRGYDVGDAKVGALVKTMLVSLALMVGSTAAVFALYAHFDVGYQRPNKGLTTEQKATITPPLPHLQADPFRELDVATTEQERRLTTYGWTSPDHDRAHIPIARAMQQVVGKPLDGPAQATEPPSGAKP